MSAAGQLGRPGHLLPAQAGQPPAFRGGVGWRHDVVRSRTGQAAFQFRPFYQHGERPAHAKRQRVGLGAEEDDLRRCRRLVPDPRRQRAVIAVRLLGGQEDLHTDRPDEHHRPRQHRRDEAVDDPAAAQCFRRPRGDAGQEQGRAGVGRQEVVAPLEAGTRQHRENAEKPRQPEACERVVAEQATPPRPHERRDHQRAPGQEIADELRAVEPPRVTPQRPAAERPLDVVVPEEHAEQLAAGIFIGGQEPGQRQHQDQRHAPPRPEPPHQPQPRPDFPDGGPLLLAEQVRRHGRDGEDEADRPLEQHARRAGEVGDQQYHPRRPLRPAR